MMIIIQGALLALTQGKTLTNLSEGYIWIGQATIGGWPLMPVVFLLVLAVMGAVLKYTVLGRSIYAVGGNPVASNSAGIRVARVKIIAYTISGFLAALAGFCWHRGRWPSPQTKARATCSTPSPRPLSAASVFGGHGNVKGVLGGVLLLTVIQVGLAIVNVPSFYVGMIGGVIILSLSPLMLSGSVTSDSPATR